VSALGRFILFAATLLLTSAAFAQERCGTDLIEKKALLKNPQLRSDFESWMKKKITARRSQNLAGARTSTAYKIPVVVHIIHNGEAVGAGTNISDAQVMSQIKVLNDDYQRLNADAANTPAEFAAVASSLNIEFVLAKQDPDGLPTNGITRTLGSKNGYDGYDDNAEIKSQVYWPAEDYLNIWVVNLISDFLGIAQFPETDLQGTTGPYDAITDGVLIHYRAFGSVAGGAFNLDPKYNLGRTTTHEVGHFLGLIHIFGSSSGMCNTTDYVDDTPVQPEQTFSCPSGPIDACTPPHHIMYQNYMDYTQDACMNLFTAKQVERMQTVLDNSPRRNTLSSSPGLVAPFVPTLDLEAKEVSSPMSITCGKSIVPRLVIRNRGSTTITSAKIQLKINGNIIETKDATLNLASIESTTVSFNTIDLDEPSSNTVVYTILQVNGGSDDQVSNDIVTLVSNVSERIVPPTLEPFNSAPANWTIVNPDSKTTWMNTTAPKSMPTNKAMYLDWFDYQNQSARDLLMSPYYTLPDEDALLRFDHAYAVFPGYTTERLRVLLSIGCSADPADAIEIFNRAGSTLATAPNQQTKFTPSSEAQWSSNGISLAQYGGQDVRLIFEGTNQNGNNLYLDNVQITAGDLNDVRAVSVVSPGPVFCVSNPQPVIEVQNLGTKTVNNLQVVTVVNGVASASETFTGLNMTPGTLLQLTLAKLNIRQSTNALAITITDPDVSGDDVPLDNTLKFTRMFNSETDVIPLRQNFDDNTTAWTIFADDDNPRWQTVTTRSYKNSLVYKAYNNPDKGEESWFVSPSLDMRRANQGGLFFSTSYGRILSASENLKIYASEDCGLTYDQIIFDKSGLDLANETVTTEWSPPDTSKWTRQYVSINDFAGKENIRFAFVVTNDNGNDLYLDNIEIFMADDDNPPKTDELFVVYNSETNPYEFYVTFNLPEKQDARLLIYSLTGQVLVDSDLPGTLNQTYTVNLYGQSSGIYIARLQTPSLTRSSKVFIGK
jgi:hypothetical protein